MNLLLSWNAIALETIRALGQLPFSSAERNRGGPPQVARSLGLIHTAAYDAVAKPRHSTTPRRPAAERTVPCRTAAKP